MKVIPWLGYTPSGPFQNCLTSVTYASILSTSQCIILNPITLGNFENFAIAYCNYKEDSSVQFTFVLGNHDMNSSLTSSTENSLSSLIYTWLLESSPSVNPINIAIPVVDAALISIEACVSSCFNDNNMKSSPRYVT